MTGSTRITHEAGAQLPHTLHNPQVVPLCSLKMHLQANEHSSVNVVAQCVLLITIALTNNETNCCCHAPCSHQAVIQTKKLTLATYDSFPSE